jgi:hypothetical protein
METIAGGGVGNSAQLKRSLGPKTLLPRVPSRRGRSEDLIEKCGVVGRELCSGHDVRSSERGKQEESALHTARSATSAKRDRTDWSASLPGREWPTSLRKPKTEGSQPSANQGPWLTKWL